MDCIVAPRTTDPCNWPHVCAILMRCIGLLRQGLGFTVYSSLTLRSDWFALSQMLLGRDAWF